MTDMLVVVPHPDDETLSAGGTIRQATRRGDSVTVVTLTRGEEGRTLGICPQEQLAEMRSQEFTAAMSLLGVADALLFPYPDGGLASRSDEAAEDLRVLVERTRPAVVATFPANGMNGHPDHVASHHITRAALRLSGWAPRTVLTFADPHAFRDGPRPGYLVPQEVNRLRVPPNRTHGVADVAEDKLRALGCYDTQARSVLKFLRLHPQSLQTETFHASAWPPGT
ncbi:PIG-L family deacetylase [Frankia sp. AgPm24]|uniref:PIG-L deacetylase family protein n=1 Tax=Frankia sp. AgPm24 TaxID=631128 RepID=UPI00200DEB8F|nr:PIG-L family deacetylase [Frankia sp. AgPm24]MCK9923338.1 PIG-L family deacetylase [Frankia sp. AgPm24]